MARDCRGRGDPNLAKNNQTQFDSEYSALMAELGESATGVANPTSNPNQVPPWRIPENWNTNSKLEFLLTHDRMLMVDFKGVGQAPPQGGYQQGGQQGGYGYGGYPGGDPNAAAGYGGGDPNAAAAYGGYGGQAAPGGADPYAA